LSRRCLFLLSWYLSRFRRGRRGNATDWTPVERNVLCKVSGRISENSGETCIVDRRKGVGKVPFQCERATSLFKNVHEFDLFR
jgi:hypothetical protein